MALNYGTISLGGTNTGESIALELGRSATATISLGESGVYGMAGFNVQSNIDMGSFRGKAGRKVVSDAGTPTSGTFYNLSLDPSIIPGYIQGKTDIIYTIRSGVVVGSTSVGAPAFKVSGFAIGDTVTVFNYGYIIGKGGDGGYGRPGKEGYYGAGYVGNGTAGGLGIQIGFNTKIHNHGTISGGGGGGGGGEAMIYYNGGYAGGGGGGGGAGMSVGTGGAGGPSYSNYWPGYNGNPGTAYAGGIGGYSSDSRFGTTLKGGNGGGPGASGISGGNTFGAPLAGGSGGPAGAAGVGSNFITWMNYGTVNGVISA